MALCNALVMVFFLLASNSAIAANALTSFTIKNPSGDPSEVTMQFKYGVTCSGSSKGNSANFNDINEDQVRGYIVYQGRRIVIDFYRYRNELEIALGSGPIQPEEAVLELESSSTCRLDRIEAQIKYENVNINGSENPRDLMEKLALIHSPFINLRENQYDRSPNDTPLLLAYSVHEGQANWVAGKLSHNNILRYTVFLSDEDNQYDSADTNAQMARYGRTTDIEWVYEVELDANLKAVRESYQGALHFPYTYSGEYLPAPGAVSTHPILFNYNLDDNNVFVDTTEAWIDHLYNPKQKSRRVGHQLVPRIRVENPHSRERLMFSNSWMFKVSEAELRREHRSAVSPKDQLFVLVRGKLLGGSFLGEITSTSGEVFSSGGNPCNKWRCNVAELGTDLWGEEDFTGIPVSVNRLNMIGTPEFSGEFRLRDSVFLDLRLKRLRFFRLRDLGQTYGVEELSSKFKCDYRDEETICRF